MNEMETLARLRDAVEANTRAHNNVVVRLDRIEGEARGAHEVADTAASRLAWLRVVIAVVVVVVVVLAVGGFVLWHDTQQNAYDSCRRGNDLRSDTRTGLRDLGRKLGAAQAGRLAAGLPSFADRKCGGPPWPR